MVLAESVMEIRIFEAAGAERSGDCPAHGPFPQHGRASSRTGGQPGLHGTPVVPSKLDAYKALVLERMTAAYPERLPGTCAIPGRAAASLIASAS